MPVERHKGTRVTIEADGRQVIQTDQRRASAVLQVLAGATLQEVGEVLGVTRERIRQYMMQCGLTTAQRQRISPQSPKFWVTFKARGSRRRERKARLRERMRRGVEYLRAYAEANGCAPTNQDFAQAMLGRPVSIEQGQPALWNFFGGDSRTGKGRHYRMVFRVAGVSPRSCGALGHVGGPTSQKRIAAWRKWAQSPKGRRYVLKHMREMRALARRA